MPPVSIVSLPDHSPRRFNTSQRPFAEILRGYFNVMYALMMHDIKNRFFGSGLGQIVMVLWPFAHIVVLMVIYVFTKRANPYGDSLIQYTAVSVFPFIIFNYVSRWIVYSAGTNRSFLQYPIIKPLDILISRAMLEMVSISIVAMLLVTLVVVCGYNAMPASPIEAFYAFAGTIFLAVGLGVLNGVITFLVPLWIIVYTLFIILMWVSSGALFVVSALPEQIQTLLSYNPLLQCTEWIRVAYYSDYPTSILDRMYVLKFGLIGLTAGLILERLVRRFI